MPEREQGKNEKKKLATLKGLHCDIYTVMQRLTSDRDHARADIEHWISAVLGERGWKNLTDKDRNHLLTTQPMISSALIQAVFDDWQPFDE